MVGLRPFGWDTAIKHAKNFTKGLPNGVETALDASANVMVDEVKKLAPSSGMARGDTYKNSIDVVHAEKGLRRIASNKFVTSISTGKTWNLGMILEFGVSHSWVIRPVLAKVLFWSSPKGVGFAQEVTHPPMPPQPHFAPAIPEVRKKFPNLFNTMMVKLWRG